MLGSSHSENFHVGTYNIQEKRNYLSGPQYSLESDIFPYIYIKASRADHDQAAQELPDLGLPCLQVNADDEQMMIVVNGRGKDLLREWFNKPCFLGQMVYLRTEPPSCDLPVLA